MFVGWTVVPVHLVAPTVIVDMFGKDRLESGVAAQGEAYSSVARLFSSFSRVVVHPGSSSSPPLL